jgi:hypothetical protein
VLRPWVEGRQGWWPKEGCERDYIDRTPGGPRDGAGNCLAPQSSRRSSRQSPLLGSTNIALTRRIYHAIQRPLRRRFWPVIHRGQRPVRPLNRTPRRRAPRQGDEHTPLSLSQPRPQAGAGQVAETVEPLSVEPRDPLADGLSVAA